MQVYQFEAFSSGPRLGVVKGPDLFSLKQANNLAELAIQAKQSGTTLLQLVGALTSQQQFNFNELVLDGRIRPPLWHQQPSQLQLWEQRSGVANGKAEWQQVVDGSKLCRPYMPIPAREHESIQPSLLIVGLIDADGRPQFLGQTLGFTPISRAPLGWCFGAGLSLADPTGQRVQPLRFSISRMAEEIFAQELDADLPSPDQLQHFASHVPLLPGAVCLLKCDMAARADSAESLPHSLEHGDALLLEAPHLTLELRSTLHHPDQAEQKWQG